MMYGYGNGYYNGIGYYPMNPTPTPQTPSTGQNGGDERIWVQGEGAAKSYLVASGATVALWDTEKPRIFLKSVAPNGFPSLTTLNYSVDAPTPTPTTIPTDNGLENRVGKLEAAFEEIKKTMKGGGEDVQ